MSSRYTRIPQSYPLYALILFLRSVGMLHGIRTGVVVAWVDDEDDAHLRPVLVLDGQRWPGPAIPWDDVVVRLFSSREERDQALAADRAWLAHHMTDTVIRPKSTA